MKYTLSLIISAVTLCGFSQVPGYLGKRASVYYDVYFSPTFVGPTASSAPSTGNGSLAYSPGMNAAHCLNVEYATGKKTSLCISGQYMKTGVAYHSGSYYANEATYTGDLTKPAQLSSFNLGLGFKFYAKGFIAPLGRYQKLEFLLLFSTVNYDNTHFQQPDQQVYNQYYGYSTTIKGGPVSLGPGTYSYTNFVLAYTLGREVIVGDRIIIDYGFRLAVAPFAVVTTDPTSSGPSNNSIENIYNYDSGWRLFREQLLNLHLGLGFLPF